MERLEPCAVLCAPWGFYIGQSLAGADTLPYGTVAIGRGEGSELG